MRGEQAWENEKATPDEQKKRKKVREKGRKN